MEVVSMQGWVYPKKDALEKPLSLIHKVYSPSM